MIDCQTLYNSKTMKTSQALKLKEMKKSLIKPYHKTLHPERSHPALWDLLYIDSYVPVIFFYRPEPREGPGRSSQFSERVAHLQESLSKVLVHNYPFAGRWVRTYDARVRELQCNDEGVPFFEAQIDEEMDTVIGDVDDFQPVPALGNFNLAGLDNLLFQQDVEFPLPPVFFQVTGFKCGGISLYAAFSHQATDGKGFFDFMAAWSQQATQGKLAAVPIHDRSLTLTLADFIGWMNSSSDAEQPTSGPEVHGVKSNGTTSSGEANGKPHGRENESSNGSSQLANGTEASNGRHLPNGEAVAVPNIVRLSDAVYRIQPSYCREAKQTKDGKNPKLRLLKHTDFAALSITTQC